MSVKAVLKLCRILSRPSTIFVVGGGVKDGTVQAMEKDGLVVCQSIVLTLLTFEPRTVLELRFIAIQPLS